MIIKKYIQLGNKKLLINLQIVKDVRKARAHREVL